ncbi:MAG: excinuclease ABC subunit UvrB [bacterium]|nr:excinuclease ABC subunit UvrB [bacterium]MCP4800521.1 excinuclease ABC subunit UvrB [bacterium]
MVSLFNLKAPFKPSGDQPEAIEALAAGLDAGEHFQTLLGVTGSGKTFTIANLIAQSDRPALIFSHNKTLAAQLYGELKGFFPDNAVEYFISYYDYYQPEAFIPSSNTYIEKDVSINEEIERLRLRATSSLVSRRDVIVVASVSAIYGLGNPETFKRNMITLKTGQKLDRDELVQTLISIHYSREDTGSYGTFRVRGDTVDIRAAYDERMLRVEFFGDEIDRLCWVDSMTAKPVNKTDEATVYPARQFVAEKEQLDRIITEVGHDLEVRLGELEAAGKKLEAERLSSRTQYDMEMIKQVGYCNGVENYSRYFDRREIGHRPGCLLDYFPDDYLMFVDESHVTLSQFSAMYKGDRSRKETLVGHGFRLPSALDNRPLKYKEFESMMPQTVFISATPGNEEMEKCEGEFIEQVIRPTGLVDPPVEIVPVAQQVDDLVARIRKVVAKGERVLVTTLTKKMAEDLAEYLGQLKMRVDYMHADVKTLDRVEILRNLRLGMSDVLVGVNLLREGLDLPEVSLVAILDADREGFLRSERSLIQTAGRAARNVDGVVVMYADKITGSMERAIGEMNRRREKQIAYNKANNITPKTIYKSKHEILQATTVAGRETPKRAVDEKPWQKIVTADMSPREMIEMLDAEMENAAEKLDFEKAALLRDRIEDLRSQWGIAGQGENDV